MSDEAPMRAGPDCVTTDKDPVKEFLVSLGLTVDGLDDLKTAAAATREIEAAGSRLACIKLAMGLVALDAYRFSEVPAKSYLADLGVLANGLFSILCGMTADPAA